LKDADELKKSGKNATVIDAYSMPLKTDEILKIAQRSGGRIVTVEDNYSGGLDAELSIAITHAAADVQLRSVVVRRIPKSGREPEEVLEYCHVGTRAILDAMNRVGR
jgi:transketolase